MFWAKTLPSMPTSSSTITPTPGKHSTATSQMLCEELPPTLLKFFHC